VQVEVREIPLSEVDSDLLAVGLAEGQSLPEPLAGASGAADVKGGYRKAYLIYPEGAARTVVVGLGKPDDLDPERARVAGAIAAKRAATLEARSLTLAPPDSGDAAATAAAMVEGAILAGFRFDRFRKSGEDDPAPQIETITVLGGPDSLGDAVEAARVVAEAQNRARELQELPSNFATPSFLSERAAELVAAHEKLSFEVLGREEIADKGMGGLQAVSKGTEEEPQLIVLRYSGGGGGAPIGLVGKAVTFDTGGISIKPAAAMHEMKMDMSGGAVVLEAIGAIAELGLPAEIIGVIPSTENMPSGTAVKPGDVITLYNGKTVEVNNTDAEGRLILGDALAYCVELGAERIVDLATLTGAVLIALGSTYAALISNNDEWAGEVAEAAAESGELAWRLPLHEEYKELTKGTIADLTNASAKRKAGTIYAGSFLEEFVDGKPWVHLDIAGTAWDTGREYVGKGPTGFGVRLLVSLAQDLSNT
jgi:leucyl aminopeptidase